MSVQGLNVKNVAIIGAGPSGLAAAKYLKAEQSFESITIFEQRSTVGGIWNTDVLSPVDAQAFPSPIYDGMESNIPKSIMQYAQVPFTADTALFPDARAVLEYIQEYARDVLDLVALRKQVLDVKVVGCAPDEATKWELTILDLQTGQTERVLFDAVVVASGRYNEPQVPTIIGLQEWSDTFPGSVIHSKYFRSEEAYQDKKVIIVGFSASGTDIAKKIEPVCRAPLLISQRSSAGLSPGSQILTEGKVIRLSIVSVNAQDRSVTFADGVEETGIDCIILCTGYHYSYPFLSEITGFEKADGVGNTKTYQHIFYTPNPTLAFALLPLRVVAFPFVEPQGAIIARVWSGRLHLPSKPTMEEWVKTNERQRGSGRDFHKMSYPKDADYMNELHAWCCGADDGIAGKVPPFWGAEERWLRQNIHAIKKAAEDQGAARFQVKAVEAVGFHFERSEGMSPQK